MIKLLRTLPLLALTGCSVYSEKFDCEPGKGVGCLALHKVDEQVDEKTLPFQVEEDAEKQAKEQGGEKKSTHVLSNNPIALVPQEDHIMRIPEESLKVWIAPYEDKQGQYHEASVVHMVIKPGKWVKR